MSMPVHPLSETTYHCVISKALGMLQSVTYVAVTYVAVVTDVNEYARE